MKFLTSREGSWRVTKSWRQILGINTARNVSIKACIELPLTKLLRCQHSFYRHGLLAARRGAAPSVIWYGNEFNLATRLATDLLAATERMEWGLCLKANRMMPRTVFCLRKQHEMIIEGSKIWHTSKWPTVLGPILTYLATKIHRFR